MAHPAGAGRAALSWVIHNHDIGGDCVDPLLRIEVRPQRDDNGLRARVGIGRGCADRVLKRALFRDDIHIDLGEVQVAVRRQVGDAGGNRHASEVRRVECGVGRARGVARRGALQGGLAVGAGQARTGLGRQVPEGPRSADCTRPASRGTVLSGPAHPHRFVPYMLMGVVAADGLRCVYVCVW